MSVMSVAVSDNGREVTFTLKVDEAKALFDMLSTGEIVDDRTRFKILENLSSAANISKDDGCPVHLWDL